MEKYVVIDLETTGHSPTKDDKIIEVGIVVIENNEITETKSTFFNPKQSIPPFITKLTGITDEDVKDAPLFHEEADKIIEIFKDSYLIAHNVPFDLGFLNSELELNGKGKLTNPVIDTVELSRILYPKSTSYKLNQLAEYLNIQHDVPHRALSDAYVTAKLFLKLKEKLDTLPYETIHSLLQLSSMFKSDLYALLNERQEKLAFSTTDRDDIETFQGLAFKQLKEEDKSTSAFTTSYGDFLDDIYEENGKLSKRMKRYEKRQGQRDMSEVIFDAFQTKKHAIIEAETGTGKSLGYLIPAIYESVKMKQRIVISTYTTQLQSQLIEQEIPLIEALIPNTFKAALIKGKHHYISLEKFAHEMHSNVNDNYDITLTKAMILIWLTETETGDIDEINLPSSGYLFYRKISTEAEGGLDPYSPWFNKSYYQKAKKKAMHADIIITNHALLAMDMFNDYQFLPTYKKVIIDEAHHFEDTAAHHYGLDVDYVNMQYVLNQIGHWEETKSLGKLLSRYTDYQDELPLKKWDEVLDHTKYEIDVLFGAIYHYVLDSYKTSMATSDVGRVQYRFEEEKEDENRWNAIKEMVTRLTFYLRDLIHILAATEQTLYKKDALDKYDKDDLNGMVDVLQGFIDRFEQLFLLESSVPQVRWVEIDTKGPKNAVFLYCEPTDISSLLMNDFFDKKESVILTSATLTMNDSFSYIEDRLGLPSDRLETERIASPFSYKDQVQLFIPTDFPDIKYGKMDDFIYATCEAILSLAEITNGRMLVLFTSYDMLKKSYFLLKEMMDLDSYVLIGQGITSGSRTKLKKNFQTFDQAILLGTSSFWEGVDIPGDDLSCLMIVRLPFQPPNHPVYEAKSNQLKEIGKNAFMEYALPNAVIKFKQGFGRLIRSTNDRGIVFICDARIMKARYGKYFIKSIPEVPITYDTISKLMEKAEEWF
ncbi:ATP-dependent DNA helicase DinG [Oceanobacillus bengalensis]|uniref:3'-5' exonuclease DinG n=1 Tax=Oceanobacillus bengalensis TaxID=1435466 RepID=A0A494YV01_9BACI|nr:ATP-dependent DNA helicase DinG [Oceanobacillus bengalensis]RKQ13932.1 ATP-dependent helicase DinG [Oceanobacillus bengalensis]